MTMNEVSTEPPGQALSRSAVAISSRQELTELHAGFYQDFDIFGRNGPGFKAAVLNQFRSD